MNIKNSLFTSALIALIAPCYGMDVELKQPERTYLPTIPMPSGEEFVSKMPPEILEHILTFVIENDPDAIGNLARIQEVCKGLAGFLSKNEMKWILELDEQELFSHLLSAVYELNTKKIQLLLNLGALSNDTYKHEILLHATVYAAGENWPYQKLLDIISILEKAGATWKEGEYNMTKSTFMAGDKLMDAIALNRFDGVRLLLEHGIKPKTYHLENASIRQRNFKIFELLLKYGAHPTAGLTLNHAILWSKFSIIKFLLEHGIKPKTYHLETASIGRQNVKIAKILLKYGARPTLDIIEYVTRWQHDPKMLKLLIAHGAAAYVNQRNHLNVTPLWYATTPENAQVLLEAGAIPDTEILNAAVDEGRDQKLIKLLIEYGADVNGIGGMIYTSPPLAYAQTAQVAKILLQAGAQISLSCTETSGIELFKHLIQRAIEEKNPAVLVEVLKQRYAFKTSLAIATALIAGAPYFRAACNIL